MKLLDRINSDFMAAYKAKETLKKNFLGLIKSEVTKESKEPTDQYIVSKIKSMIKAAADTDSLTAEEISWMTPYLPQQLTSEQLEEIISNFINREEISGPREIGKVMKYLKENFEGEYDGKLASGIIKKILS